MIEPETAPAPPAPTRWRRRAAVAGVTLVALVAGGIVVAGGGRSEPAPLALRTGGTRNETAAGMAAVAPQPAGDASKVGEAGSATPAIAPYPGGGVTYTVDGTLPDLPGRADAWTVSGP
ncbi:MAG TPA: hypothetical protein VHL53_10565, partial [Acidimicrobiia bacterium]|nr:hypothetical protein [Acidimicrobiia bacterium]